MIARTTPAAPRDRANTAKSYPVSLLKFLTPEPDLMDDTSFCNEDIAFFKATTSELEDCLLTGGKSSIAVDSTSLIGTCTSTLIPLIPPLFLA